MDHGCRGVGAVYFITSGCSNTRNEKCGWCFGVDVDSVHASQYFMDCVYMVLHTKREF